MRALFRSNPAHSGNVSRPRPAKAIVGPRALTQETHKTSLCSINQPHPKLALSSISAIVGQRPVGILAHGGHSYTLMENPNPSVTDSTSSEKHHYRFHLPHLHLTNVFGGDWFALKAEAFARFFGTPVFLIAQTVIVAVWIGLNVFGFTSFDIYPFVFLNLAFSLQAAYAAPLILLAQTRQADRDKVHAEADAQHREDLAKASEERQILAAKENAVLTELVKQNTQLTQITQKLTERIEALTEEMHRKVVEGGK